LQQRILRTLAGIEPPFVLAGGGAVAGFYLGHRSTRDLDLFWRRLGSLGDLPDTVRRRLTGAGLSVEPIQTAPQFHRFVVNDGTDSCVLDLVADPAPPREPPVLFMLGGVEIQVESTATLLAEKLCALLGRTEARDLDDAGLLLADGALFERSLALASQVDGGFSAVTLAWVLSRWDLRSVGEQGGYDDESMGRLEGFRSMLIERLIAVLPGPRP
jgi:hypothetical protein